RQCSNSTWFNLVSAGRAGLVYFSPKITMPLYNWHYQQQRREITRQMTQENPTEPDNTSSTTSEREPDVSSEMEMFDDLMSNYLDSMHDLEVGQLSQATVVEIGKDTVLLDIGDKAEGICPVKEFQDFRGNTLVNPGQEVEVVIESRDSDTGQVNVSYRKARHRAEWGKVVEAFEQGKTLYGQVTRALKNGVLVDVGVPCFLPGSQIGLNRVENLESLVGENL